MDDQFGSDYMTIVDEDGEEYELEILTTMDWNGSTYLAVIPAGMDEEVEEDGEPILCAIEDQQELETVYGLIMEQLYEEDEEEEE